MSNKKFNLDIEFEICFKYLDNIKTNKLSQTYGCSVSTILQILKRNKIEIKTNGEAHKKYSLNEHYFKFIDSEDKAYWLGWFYSDGCNQQNFNVSISLQEQDCHMIELLKKYINSNRPLYAKQKGGKELQLRSQQLSDSLYDLGCVYNKSLILEFPTNKQVPSKLLPHFIRGYFEGDGCIGVYKDKNMISILGTECFLSKMKIFLKSQGIDKIHLNSKTKNTYNLTIWTKDNIVKFKNLIYDNYLENNETNSELILKRKYDKFLIIQNN